MFAGRHLQILPRPRHCDPRGWPAFHTVLRVPGRKGPGPPWASCPQARLYSGLCKYFSQMKTVHLVMIGASGPATGPGQCWQELFLLPTSRCSCDLPALKAPAFRITGFQGESVYSLSSPFQVSVHQTLSTSEMEAFKIPLTVHLPLAFGRRSAPGPSGQAPQLARSHQE